MPKVLEYDIRGIDGQAIWSLAVPEEHKSAGLVVLSFGSFDGDFLNSGGVLLWFAEVSMIEAVVGGMDLGWLSSNLDAEERARAARFRHPLDRATYSTARAGLRHYLAAATRQSAEAVRFRSGPNGKPELQRSTESAPIHFSVSHSGACVAIGFARYPLGIDIEANKPIDGIDILAKIALSGAENLLLDSLPEAEREDTFLRMWTRKEAVLKASGKGLSIDPRRLTVGVEGFRTFGPPITERAWCLLEPETKRSYCRHSRLPGV